MPIDLGRRLIAAGAVTADEVEAALFLSVVRGVPFPRALVDRGALGERAIDEELGRRGGLALRNVVGVPDLMAKLPASMCRRLGAVPTRLDPFTGTVDVAAADPLDLHVATEFGFHLGAPIRVIRAPITAIEEAIRRLELDEAPDAKRARARSRRATPPFPHGAPSSSVPPPPSEEAPIPLVRRAGGSLLDEAAIDRRDEVVPAQARKARETLRMGALVAPLDDAPPTVVEGPRPPALRDPPGELPRVSFPSEPPVEPTALPGARRAAAGARPTIRVDLPEHGTRGPAQVEAWPSIAAAAAAWSPPAHAASPAHVTPAHGSRAATPAEALRADRAAPTVRGRGKSSRPPGARPQSRRPISGAAASVAAVNVPRAGALPSIEMPAPPRPPVDRAAALEALRAARSRDEVIRHALIGMSAVARRVAVFVVKRDGFHGWACNAELGDVQALRAVAVPLDQPSIFATAAAASVYLGPVPSTPVHASLLAVIGRASSDVAATTVRAGGRPVLVLLADELDDTTSGTRFLESLAEAAGEALVRVIAARA